MLRVLSANLFIGRARPDALLELVSREAIDVVCAQELSPALALALGDLLPHGDRSTGNGSRGNGIACRNPVSTRRIAMPNRDGLVATLEPADWPGLSSALQIVNVHISAPHYWPWFPNPVRRARQLQSLLDDRRATPVESWAVLGDFNASPAWPVYRRMAGLYQDAARMNGSRPSRTWPRIAALGLRGLIRIDHCFVAGLQATAVTAVDLPGSDHLGLLVDLAPAGPGDNGQPV